MKVVPARVTVLALAALLTACSHQLAGSAVAVPPQASGSGTVRASPSPGPSPPAPSTADSTAATDSSPTVAAPAAPEKRLELSVTAGVVLDPAARERVAGAAQDLLAGEKVVATVSVVPPDRIAVVTGTGDAKILDILGGARRLQWLPVRSAAPAQPAACDRPATAGSQCDVAGDTRYELEKPPFPLTGVGAITVHAAPDQNGGWVVEFAVDVRTRAAVGEYTTANVGKSVALSDGLRVITAPTVPAPIRGGRLVISGAGNERDSRAVAARIMLAALEVEIGRR